MKSIRKSPGYARASRVALASACVAAAIPASAHAALPGGRGYEQISPVDKNGGQVLRMAPTATPDGDAVLLAKNAPNPDSIGGFRSVPIVARRAASGWVATDVTSPLTFGGGGGNFAIYGATPDLATLFVNSNRPIGTATEGGMFAIDSGSRTAARLGLFELANVPQSNGVLIVRTPDGLYRRRGQSMEKVSLLPDGSDAQDDANFRQLWSPPLASSGIDQASGFAAGGIRTAVGNGWIHNVSVDGERVFFNSGFNYIVPQVDPATTNPLYVRDGNDRTVAVSASRRADDDGAEQPARFIGASADGNVVYFSSDAPLTEGIEGGAVYRYRLSDGQLLRLSGNPGPNGLGISSAWSSEDASSVYFVATAALAPDAVEGSQNAYVWRDGELRFVADLGADGVVERVSRDGSFAVLSSSTSIGAGVDTGGTRQLYRYRASDGRVDCASCRADGSANEGPSTVRAKPDAIVAEITNPRAITDDGHIFFTSNDRLTSADTSSAPDVYSYDDAGVHLISDGSGGPAYVTDNTDDGRSVFFVTTQKLVAQDTDGGEYDLYAARTGGGFAAPVDDVPCRGDACRPSRGGSVAVPAPGSGAPGKGNVVPPKTAPKPALRGRPTVTAATARQIARSGRGTVRLRLRGPGRVSLRATATIAGKVRTVARTSRTASKAATSLALTVRLSVAARRELRRSGRLRVRFTASMAGNAKKYTTTVTLKKVGR